MVTAAEESCLYWDVHKQQKWKLYFHSILHVAVLQPGLWPECLLERVIYTHQQFAPVYYIVCLCWKPKDPAMVFLLSFFVKCNTGLSMFLYQKAFRPWLLAYGYISQSSVSIRFCQSITVYLPFRISAVFTLTISTHSGYCESCISYHVLNC